VPIQKWLAGPFDAACEQLFDKNRLDRYGILSSAELSDGRFRRWVSGRDPSILWHVFVLAAWCEATLGDGPEALRELLHGRLVVGASRSTTSGVKASAILPEPSGSST
jgi:hypothetical protein